MEPAMQLTSAGTSWATLQGLSWLHMATPPLPRRDFPQAPGTSQPEQAAAAIVTAIFDDPTGYGRVVRDGQGHVLGVVEHKDANGQELQIKEINTGTYCFDSQLLFHYLTQITPENAQAEYYLPDVIPLMIKGGHTVEVLS